MAFLREISIEGLFGLYDHSVSLRKSPPVTILAGPNGIGKTTLLGLATGLLNGAYRDVAKQEFKVLTVTSGSGATLKVEPVAVADDAEGGWTRLRLSLQQPGEKRQESVIDVPISPADLALPAYVEQLAPDSFFDSRSGEIIPRAVAVRRYGVTRGPAHSEPEPPDWFDRSQWPVDFIETKRLDTLMMRGRGRRREPPAAPIDSYLSAVAESLEQARRRSARLTQTADRTFARRLLNKASRMTVNAEKLRKRYAEVGERAKQLTATGLLADSLDVLPDGKLNPTEKRILSLFLDDFEAKLKPLDPVAAKVDRLRSVIERKFLNKEITFDLQKGVLFYALPDRREIDPDALSSGEQHELALISRLLFTEQPGTTVLIDEPELSLHVSWQHEMVDDLIEIAEVASLSFLLATHSTAIINGKWDLVDELGPLEGPSS
jgi:energy-coupling factor transporter ATP-binding protein EcfA2